MSSNELPDTRTEPRRSSGLALALLALVALYALARMGLAPPAAKPADAPESEFSAARARTVLEKLFGDGAPHPVGSAAHARVRAGIVAELERAGYQGSVQETFVRGRNGVFARVNNVLARLPGARDRSAVLVCAHYDSVAAGSGAGDDGAGVAASLEVARALAREPIADRPVMFLFDDAEEMGLIGAEAFAVEHPWAENVGVVVNVEARGTSGPSMMFETSDDNLALMQVFARAVERPVAVSAAYEIYKRMPNDTDLTVFKAHGMRGFNFAFIGGLRHYHTPLDDLAHLSSESLQHHGDNVLALVRGLARADLETAPHGRAVYTDVFGVGMVVWPEGASVPLAVAALAVFAFAAVRCIRRRELSVAAIAVGAVTCLAVVVAATAAGWSVAWLVSAVRAAPEPWAAHPAALHLALVSGIIAAALVVTRVARWRGAGVEGCFFGSWFVFAIGGVAFAATIPSACYLFVIPSALAGLCAMAWTFLDASQRERKLDSLVLAALVPLCAMWFPLAIGIELSFEYHAAGAIAAIYGIAVATAMPVATGASARHVALACRCALALCLGATCAALAVPAYSAAQPEALNLVHVQDADQNRAGWSARAGSHWAPTLASLAATDAPPPAGWLARAEPKGAYSAPIWDVRAPEFTVFESVGTATGRIVRARLRSQRGARTLGFELPIGVRLLSATWRNHTVADIEPDDRSHLFVALGDENLEIALEVEGGAPVELDLFDGDSALPPAAGPLLLERPASRVPRSQGDGSIVCRRAQI